jgi:hypothetical protein
MTYEQALAIAYRRILNGTRAWNYARMFPWRAAKQCYARLTWLVE